MDACLGKILPNGLKQKKARIIPSRQKCVKEERALPKRDLSHQAALTVCNFPRGHLPGPIHSGPFFWSWKIFNSWALSIFISHRYQRLLVAPPANKGGPFQFGKFCLKCQIIVLQHATGVCFPEYSQSIQLETPLVFLKLMRQIKMITKKVS